MRLSIIWEQYFWYCSFFIFVVHRVVFSFYCIFYLISEKIMRCLKMTCVKQSIVGSRGYATVYSPGTVPQLEWAPWSGVFIKGNFVWGCPFLLYILLDFWKFYAMLENVSKRCGPSLIPLGSAPQKEGSFWQAFFIKGNLYEVVLFLLYCSVFDIRLPSSCSDVAKFR